MICRKRCHFTLFLGGKQGYQYQIKQALYLFMIMTNNFINRRISLIHNPVTLDQVSSHVYGGHRGDCPQENRRGYPLPTHRGEEKELNQSSLVCSFRLYKLYQETYHFVSICIYVVEGINGQAKSSEITLIQLLSQGKEYQSFSKQTNHC